MVSLKRKYLFKKKKIEMCSNIQYKNAIAPLSSLKFALEELEIPFNMINTVGKELKELSWDQKKNIFRFTILSPNKHSMQISS
jgi:hypothetical protein